MFRNEYLKACLWIVCLWWVTGGCGLPDEISAPTPTPPQPQTPEFADPIINPFGLTDIGNHAIPFFVDIDADGDLDFFCGKLNGDIWFAYNLNNAYAPSFGPYQTNPFGLKNVGSYAAPCFADLDGDGLLDALVGNGDGNILFFKNNGTQTNPSFASPSTNPFGLQKKGEQAIPFVVDYEFLSKTSDGDLDIYVGYTTNPNYLAIYFFINNPDTASEPQFKAWIEIASANGFTENMNLAPAIVDLDQDGRLELFFGVESGNIYYNKWDGLSSYELNPFGLSKVSFSAVPRFFDIDTDGDLDAFIGSGDGNIYFFRNKAVNN